MTCSWAQSGTPKSSKPLLVVPLLIKPGTRRIHWLMQPLRHGCSSAFSMAQMCNLGNDRSSLILVEAPIICPRLVACSSHRHKTSWIQIPPKIGYVLRNGVQSSNTRWSERRRQQHAGCMLDDDNKMKRKDMMMENEDGTRIIWKYNGWFANTENNYSQPILIAFKSQTPAHSSHPASVNKMKPLSTYMHVGFMW